MASTLYVWIGGECSIYTREDDGTLRCCGGDDLPEAFCEDTPDGACVFEGVVVDPRTKTDEELDDLGISPSEARKCDEWWQGHMRPATDGEVLAVLGEPRALGGPDAD